MENKEFVKKIDNLESQIQELTNLVASYWKTKTASSTQALHASSQAKGKSSSSGEPTPESYNGYSKLLHPPIFSTKTHGESGVMEESRERETYLTPLLDDLFCMLGS